MAVAVAVARVMARSVAVVVAVARMMARLVAVVVAAAVAMSGHQRWRTCVALVEGRQSEDNALLGLHCLAQLVLLGLLCLAGIKVRLLMC